MKIVSESYVLVAGDVAAAYCGRGYNPALGRFENLPGTNLTPFGGDLPARRLKLVECRAFHAGGGGATGVLFWIGVAFDHLHPELLITLANPVHSVSRRGVSWYGDVPMGGGVVWRVALGGLIAGDYVGWTVGYD